MTEERIKEFVQSFHLGWTRKHFEDTEILIRSVAAEARKEGIEALQNDLKKWPAAGVVWISVDALDKAAERLKEQRK